MSDDNAAPIAIKVLGREYRGRSDQEAEHLQTVASYQEDMSRSFAALTRYLGLVGLAALARGTCLRRVGA